MSGVIKAAEAALDDHRRTLDPAMFGDADRQRTRAALLAAISAAYPQYADYPWVVYQAWQHFGGTIEDTVADLRASYERVKARRQATPPELRHLT